MFAFAYAISACTWLIVSFGLVISVQLFIVKRYQKETDLLDTVWFSEHANFTTYLPDLFSAPAYCAHLLSCIWFWRYVKDKKSFRDLENPQSVTCHFSIGEIARVKFLFLCGGITVLHVMGFWAAQLFN